MDRDASFGRLLRRVRKAHDLTQEALAQQAYCVVDTIKKIEAGLRRPSRQLAAQFADCLGLVGDERSAFLAAARAIVEAETDTRVEATALLDSAPVPATPAHRSNLPHQVTPLVGRAAELSALDALFATSTRLVSLLGPGGMGKTRLAIALAEQLLAVERFPDGVYFVSLAPLPAPEYIIPTLAEALDFSLDTGKQQRLTPQQQVFDYLHTKRLLLVLDNIEHLLGDTDADASAASLVAGLLAAAPGVAILTTTRQRLKLHEEQVYPLGGLDVPGTEDPSRYSAVELFVQRARLLRPDFTPETDDLIVVAQICRLVEGMPLAIELAAGWVDTLALSDIGAEIVRGLDLFATELRDVPARHRSMRAVFDATWHRLGAAEQLVFARLAVFRGGSTRKAVQAVTTATLPQLHALLGASLLQYDAKRDRYSIHELLRQYAAEQLTAEAQDDLATRERHAVFFCALLNDLRTDLQGACQQQALAAIEADGENVRMAWEWAARQPNAALIDHAMDCLGYFYEWQGRAEEGAAAYGLAAAALMAASTPDAQQVRAKLLAWQSRYMYMLGDKTAAGALLAQSQDLLNSPNLAHADTRAERAFVLLQAGRLSAEHDYGAARAAYEQSQALFQALGDRWGEAEALLGLGYATHGLSGDYALAQHWYRESLALRRVMEDRLGIVETLAKQSETTRYLGRVAESEQLARESYALSTTLGNRRTLALAASNLGSALYWNGQFAESHRLLEEAVSIYTDLVDRASLANAYFRRGIAETYLSRYTDARTTFAHQIQLARALGAPVQVGTGLICLMFVGLAQGN
jgi:predicted ATPase/transcriptional regulator with XRE-family HTH domain